MFGISEKLMLHITYYSVIFIAVMSFSTCMNSSSTLDEMRANNRSNYRQLHEAEQAILKEVRENELNAMRRDFNRCK